MRRLVRQRARTPSADDEMRLDVELAETLEQPHAVDRARRTGQSDD
jgi:hypothetical protein